MKNTEKLQMIQEVTSKNRVQLREIARDYLFYTTDLGYVIDGIVDDYIDNNLLVLIVKYNIAFSDSLDIIDSRDLGIGF